METPIGSISHSAETAAGKDALGDDCASEHPVDRSGGEALRYAERAMEMVSGADDESSEGNTGAASRRNNRDAGHGRLDESSYNRSPGAEAPRKDQSGVAAIARGEAKRGEDKSVNSHPGVQSSG